MGDGRLTSYVRRLTDGVGGLAELGGKGASLVRLTLRCDSRGIRLEVRDDGRGFEPEAARVTDEAGGFGLVTMRERIEALAGRLVVDSRPGGGTAVRAEVPA